MPSAPEDLACPGEGQLAITSQWLHASSLPQLSPPVTDSDGRWSMKIQHARDWPL
jgi:hypothetical protein